MAARSHGAFDPLYCSSLYSNVIHDDSHFIHAAVKALLLLTHNEPWGRSRHNALHTHFKNQQKRRYPAYICTSEMSAHIKNTGAHDSAITACC